MGRGALVGLLTLTACFNGEGALGLPCDNDRQCGQGQSCVQGICGGPGETTTTATVGPGTSTGPHETDVTSSPTMPDTISGSASTTASTTTEPSTGSDGSTGGAELCPQPVLEACDGVAPLDNVMFEEVEISFSPGTNPMTVVAGDFDGDEGIELATVHFLTGQITVHEWNPNTGEFDLLLTSPPPRLPFPQPLDMAGGDIDCDGSTDLAMIDAQRLTVFRGATDPFLSEAIEQALPGSPLSVTIAESVDELSPGPGIFVAAGGDGVVGDANGSLCWADWDFEQEALRERAVTPLPSASPWDIVAVPGLEPGTTRLMVPDSDEDNSTGENDDPLLVYEVAAAGLSMVGTAGQFSNPYAVADLRDPVGNRVAIVEKKVNLPDGNSDEPGWLTLCEVGPEGMLVCEPERYAPVGAGAIAVGDFDCDGVDDLVVGGSDAVTDGNGEVWVYWGKVDHNQTQVIGNVVATGHRMAVADFDGDGYPDIAVPDFGDEGGVEPSRVVVYLARD